MKNFKLSAASWHLLVNYKLALAKSICQQLYNSSKGICHLPMLLQLLTNSP